LGLQPITEKNVLFEMTTSMLLHDKGTRQEMSKPFPRPSFTGDCYLTPEHGAQMRDWIGGGSDPIESARNQLKLAATEGSEALEAAWMELPKLMRQTLNTFKDTLKHLAAHADTERLAALGDRGEPQA